MKKRIRGLEPEIPAAQAARRVLNARLRAVEMYLPIAHRRYLDDVEYVHQLRVSTRQAGAALQVFADLLPEKRTRKMTKQLRKIRRAAGAARDCDVHLMYFRKLAAKAPDGDRSVVNELCAWTDSRRHFAQFDIDRIALRYPVRRLRRGRRALLDAIDEGQPCIGPDSSLSESLRDEWKPRGELTLGEFASVGIPRVLASVQEAASRDLSVVENLHRLRVQLKRLRYALEAFGSCASAEDRETLAALKSLQDRLGQINDRSARIRWINEFALRRDMDEGGHETADGSAPTLLAMEQARFEESRSGFLDDWAAGRWSHVFERLRSRTSKFALGEIRVGQEETGGAAA